VGKSKKPPQFGKARGHCGGINRFKVVAHGKIVGRLDREKNLNGKLDFHHHEAEKISDGGWWSPRNCYGAFGKSAPPGGRSRWAALPTPQDGTFQSPSVYG